MLGTLFTLPLVLTACGSEAGPTSGPSGSESVACLGHADPARTTLDLDGDGTADDLQINGAPVGGGCRDAVIASIAGRDLIAALPGDTPVTSKDLATVRISGRSGDLLLMTAQHPRGGFQAFLFGYADGRLEQLEVDGSPIFPFVATDALTDPLSATCVEGGFEVTTARRHEPIGVVAAWDVSRTTYVVDGNAVTAGTATEIADNVLDKDLPKKYTDLVHYRLFENCRVSTG